MNHLDYIEDFAKAAVTEAGSLFLGAGLSISSGLPTWKELLRPFAKELSIDIENSRLSLYEIAQIYENEKGVALRDKVKERINTIPQKNSSIKLLTELPCKSIWTTNYDCFIEDAYRQVGVAPNIVSTEKDLTSIDPHRKVNVFKLNGDINSFNTSAVITKVDYEKYSTTHSLMQSFLKKELITHNFLFIGYSFSDDLVLSSIASIREALDGCSHMPRHYAVLKRDNSPEFRYTIRNYEKNYNIYTIEIDDYDEIPEILKLIKYYSNRRSIFISGAFRDNDKAQLEKVDKFCQNLALSISDENYKIINGYGYKIGYYIACALTDAMIKSNYSSLQDKLMMYPFNEHSTYDDKTEHRKFMISKCNIAIFIFGSQEDKSGVIDEFRIAEELGLAIIPVGGTGGAAKIIYDHIRDHITMYPYLEKEIDNLGTYDIGGSNLIKAILRCINNAIEMQDNKALSNISYAKHDN